MVFPHDYENDPDAQIDEEKHRASPEHDLRARDLAVIVWPGCLSPIVAGLVL